MSANGNILLELVLPVYNEVLDLESAVDRVSIAMSEQRFRWQIVIADNGSTDGTTLLAERLSRDRANVRTMRLDVKGRGSALRKTWCESQAEYSLYMDVDLSTDLAAIPQAISLLQDGADIVAGSRLSPQSRTRRCLKREIISRGYNRIVRAVLGTRTFDDAQCGFKGIRVMSVCPLLRLVQNNDWFFDTEMLVLAEFAGLEICTLPVTWTEDRNTKVHIPSSILQHLRGVARLWWSARRRADRWRAGSRQKRAEGGEDYAADTIGRERCRLESRLQP
jgi:glycosyltransferase involved in cell wall biosynthesis